MIQIDKTPTYKTRFGTKHETIEQAQLTSLAAILSQNEGTDSDGDVARSSYFEQACRILKSREDVLTILKLKARKPKAAKPKTPKVKKVEVAK